MDEIDEDGASRSGAGVTQVAIIGVYVDLLNFLGVLADGDISPWIREMSADSLGEVEDGDLPGMLPLLR